MLVSTNELHEHHDSITLTLENYFQILKNENWPRTSIIHPIASSRQSPPRRGFTPCFSVDFCIKNCSFPTLGVVLGMPRWNGRVGQWWPLGPKKKMFLFGLGWHACSNAQKCNKKIGVEVGFFEDFFSKSWSGISCCSFNMPKSHQGDGNGPVWVQKITLNHGSKPP